MQNSYSHLNYQLYIIILFSLKYYMYIISYILIYCVYSNVYAGHKIIKRNLSCNSNSRNVNT